MRGRSTWYIAAATVSGNALAFAMACAPGNAWAQTNSSGSAPATPQTKLPSTPTAQPGQTGAAETQPVPTTASPDQSGSDRSEDIVVTGFRASAEDAVRIKRDNIEFTDSISSEGLDRFPDLNVGEALTRIPGVQLNREAGSRDATVNLRGLPGSFAIITLNGLAFGDPVLEGSTPLGAFNSDIFSRFTVIKSPGAADQAGGLSGIIDLRINTALNRKDGGSVRVTEEYDDLGKRFSPAATLSYNKHLGSRFAVFAVGAYKEESFRRDSININSYSILSTATTPNLASILGDYYAAPGTATTGQTAIVGGTGAKSKLGVLYPSNIRQNVKDNRGKLYTGAAGMEYEFSKSLKGSVTGFFTKRNLDQAATDIYTISLGNVSGSNPSLITPDTSTLFTTPDGRNYIERLDYNNGGLNGSKRLEQSAQQTWGINPRLDFKNDKWRASTIAVYSRAYNTFNQIQVDSASNPINLNAVTAPVGNGNSGSVYSGSGDVTRLAYSINPPLPLRVPGTSFQVPGTTITVPGTPFRPATPFSNQQLLQGAFGTPYLLQITGTYSASHNEVKSIQQDVERSFPDFFISGLQLGARYEDNVYDSDGYRISAIGVNTASLSQNFITPSEYSGDFFGGKLPGVLTNQWQTVDLNVAVPALLPLTVPAGLQRTPSGFINNNFDNAYVLYNYTNTNKVISGYGLAKLDFRLLGIRFRGNLGLRYEHTDNELVVLDRTAVNTATALPVQVTKTFNRSYGYALPSGIVAVDLTDRLVLRVGEYKTYVRPQRRELSPVTAVNSVTGTGSTTLQVAIGNVNIKPYTAWSTDVALEWYNTRGSLVAVNYFRKKIDNFITPINDVRISCPTNGLINGVDYGLGTLTYNPATNECRSSNLDANGNGLFVNATGSVNNATPVTVQGVEVNVQQNLSFLPAPFNNLGGQANYSRTTVSGTTSGGAKVVLNGVSKNNYNLIAFYETKPFGIRLVYNYRDRYELASTGTFSGAARSARSRGQFDLSASIRTKEGFSFGIDAFNLTNSLREEFEQVDRVLRRSDYDGRTFQLTVRKSL